MDNNNQELKDCIVMNVTDGVLASPDEMTHDEVEAFIKAFPERYRGQGYYFTADRQRIDPKDVILKIIPI